MRLLSPAKDEGWRNYGTERQVQTPFAPPQLAQSKLGLPHLPGWGCRQGARAREFQQKVQVGHCWGGNSNVERGWKESWGSGVFWDCNRKPSESRSGRWAMPQSWKHFWG